MDASSRSPIISRDISSEKMAMGTRSTIDRCCAIVIISADLPKDGRAASTTISPRCRPQSISSSW
jgi:hypothetical protein